jgi:hypothetical protein
VQDRDVVKANREPSILARQLAMTLQRARETGDFFDIWTHIVKTSATTLEASRAILERQLAALA